MVVCSAWAWPQLYLRGSPAATALAEPPALVHVHGFPRANWLSSPQYMERLDFEADQPPPLRHAPYPARKSG